MAIVVGTAFGTYQILAPLGAGGMGVVYRARDTRLGREVAIKTLPDTFSADPDQLGRLEREARALAALNHPHIGTIYGIEEADGVRALVLELVEGPTLAERMAQGTITLKQAVEWARQIAEALEAAHDRGFVHRDLKPSNIKVRPDGVIKVLDFGLAKTWTGPKSDGTTIAGTREGVIVGTAAYMSPEQARGQAVDKRTDIWAFGCVLYEMLTGRGPFQRETPSDTIAAVLEREPDWGALPVGVSATLRRLLKRCLHKEAKHRLHDIADARIELDDAASDMGDAQSAPEERSARPRAHASSRRYVLRAAAVLAVLVLIAIVARPIWWPQSPAPPITRLSIPLAAADAFSGAGRPMVAISPDGRRIVYTANQRLYMRTLDQLDAVPIAGTEPPPAPGPGRDPGSATMPFFSPDGHWVGFSQGGALKKVAVDGGNPVEIYRGGLGTTSWGEDDTIVFGTGAYEGRTGGVWQVAAAGGAPKLVIRLEPNQLAMAPQLLPGGTEILFTLSTGSHWDDADIVIQSLETGARHVLFHGGVSGKFTASGHLLYGSRGKLFAVGLDRAAHRTVGTPMPLVSGVAQSTEAGAWGGFEYDVSISGTLVYATDAAVAIRRQLVWVDRQGNEEPLATEPRAYQYPRISPDGRRVALDMRDQQNDVWIWEFAGRTLTRLTFGRQAGGPGIWTRDGQRVIFGPDHAGIINLFSQPANGAGAPERLLTSPYTQYAGTLTPDGRRLVFEEVDPKTRFDLHVLELDGSGTSRPLLQTPFNEQNAELSPDGRWLAYQSDESGRAEVYVRPFPNVEAARFTVSTGGGTRPLWSHDGHELFYLDLDRRMMAVPILKGTTLGAGSARALFETRSFGLEGIGRNFDVSPDGTRFLMVRNLGTLPDAKRLVVVLNWAEELNSRVPGK